MFFKQSSMLAFFIQFWFGSKKNLVEKVNMYLRSTVEQTVDGIFDDPYLTQWKDSSIGNKTVRR